MSLGQELCHLRTCGVQAGQDGEDGLAALLYLLVQHLVSLVERG